MANRKLGAVEGDICWFCKLPSDDECWMGLGILKSTRQPVFNGRHILYHECCAVYSCGAEDTPPSGMDDESVMKFYRHGEKAAGIGLKCHLCGKRGATTGCFHGPCQQFYHYPCARVRAYMGYLRFSLDGKRLACMEHAPLLPLPHESEFMGMWMEGLGSWNGMLMEQSRESWHPHYALYQSQFIQKWECLLNLTPAADIKVMQELVKGRRKGIKQRSKAAAKADPDYRVKGGSGHQLKKSLEQQQQQNNRTSSSGGGAVSGLGTASQAGTSRAGGGKKQRHRQHQQPQQQQPMLALQQQQQGWWGVPDEVAAAAQRVQYGAVGGVAAAAAAGVAAGGGSMYPATSRSSFLEGGGSGELMIPTSAGSRQQYQLQSDQQQWLLHSGAAVGHSTGAGTGGGGRQALRHLLNQPGVELQVELPHQGLNPAVAPKPQISCKLLLAAAGFNTEGSEPQQQQHATWGMQRVSAVGDSDPPHHYCQHQQQQEQQGGMLAAGHRVSSTQIGAGAHHPAAAAAVAGPGADQGGGAAPGIAAAVAAAVAALHAAHGTSNKHQDEKAARGGSGGDASSADSALHAAAEHGQQQQQQQQHIKGVGQAAINPAAADAQLVRGRGGQVVFRYTAGVLVGPAGCEERDKQHKMLDINILAHTGRKQLSMGLVDLHASTHTAQQQQQQQQQPLEALQQHMQALQQLLPPGAAAPDPGMFENIITAVKAVHASSGGNAQPEALAAAAMVAVAATTSSRGAGAAAAAPGAPAAAAAPPATGAATAAAAATGAVQNAGVGISSGDPTAAAAAAIGRPPHSPAGLSPVDLLADEQLCHSDGGMQDEPQQQQHRQQQQHPQQQAGPEQQQGPQQCDGQKLPRAVLCAGGNGKKVLILDQEERDVADLLRSQFGPQ